MRRVGFQSEFEKIVSLNTRDSTNTPGLKCRMRCLKLAGIIHVILREDDLIFGYFEEYFHLD